MKVAAAKIRMTFELVYCFSCFDWLPVIVSATGDTGKLPADESKSAERLCDLGGNRNGCYLFAGSEEDFTQRKPR